MVKVKMGQVDLVDLNQTGRAPKLALSTLATVKHEPFATPSHKHAGGSAKCGRHRATGPDRKSVV